MVSIFQVDEEHPFADTLEPDIVEEENNEFWFMIATVNLQSLWLDKKFVFSKLNSDDIYIYIYFSRFTSKT